MYTTRLHTKPCFKLLRSHHVQGVATLVTGTGAYALHHMHVTTLSMNSKLNQDSGMLQGAAGAEGPQRQQPAARSMDQGPASAV